MIVMDAVANEADLTEQCIEAVQAQQRAKVTTTTTSAASAGSNN